MHYRNGREAHIGDPVIGTGYNVKGVLIGKMIDIRPGPACNCTIAILGNLARPVMEEYSQCDNLVHADDAWATAKCLPGQAAPDPTNSNGVPAGIPQTVEG